MLRNEYIKWAYGETKRDLPHIRLLQDWLVNWRRTLLAIRKVHGIFETTTIVFSKCEFLGALYRGNPDKTNWEDFKTFIDRFFRPEYKKLHKISKTKNVSSEIYSVFRSKILHGGQPVGIEDDGEIIGWWMGYGSSLREKHLKVDSKDNLNIHCGLLIDDFEAAIKKYARYLERNKHLLEKKKPRVRWYEAFWATFCPLNSDKKEWMREWHRLAKRSDE